MIIHFQVNGVKWISLVMLICTLNLAHGQDKTSGAVNGIVSKTRSILSSYDSINLAKDKISVIDTIQVLGADTPMQTIDSLSDVIARATASVNQAAKDTMEMFHSISKILDSGTTLDSGVSEVRLTSDQLIQKIERPAENIITKINEPQNVIQQSVIKTEVKLRQRSENAANSIGEMLSQTGNGKLNVPTSLLQVPDADLGEKIQEAGIVSNLPDQPSLDAHIPQQGISGIEELNVHSQTPVLSSAGKHVDIDLPAVPDADNISDELNTINDKIAEAQEYQAELQNIKENGIREAEQLPGEIENKVENIEGMQELNKAQGKITEYQDIIQRYKDEKLIKQEIERKIKMVANDKLNKFSPAVKEAQEQIAKANKLRLSIPSFKQYLKRTPNEMKGKPFMQRFVPGLTIQTYNADKFSTDLALQTGYRVSGRLTTGLGYTCRLSVDKENVNWVADEQISGYRFYTDMRLLKSIYVHGEFEYLTHNGIKQSLIPETLSPGVYGSYFGLGKRYSISRKLKGSIVGLYRVNYSGSVFGVNKLTMRVGIDLDLKKQKKKVYGGKTFRQE